MASINSPEGFIHIVSDLFVHKSIPPSPVVGILVLSSLFPLTFAWRSIKLNAYLPADLFVLGPR